MERTFISRFLGLGLITVFISSFSHSKLTVLGDFGGMPASSYWPKLNINDQTGRQQFDRSRNGKILDQLFPIVSSSLKLGKVSRSEANNIPLHRITMPIFLIGDDPVSRKWLVQNQSFLNDKKAVGLVVNVETKNDMAQLQDLAGKSIPLLPMVGDELAKILNLKHYPFYVDQNGVMR